MQFTYICGWLFCLSSVSVICILTMYKQKKHIFSLLIALNLNRLCKIYIADWLNEK